MSAARNRLVNALRRSMLQRTALRRQADTARAAFKPRALIDRGKYRLQAKVDDTAQAVRDEFRSNRLPIALAAVAGTLWLLREPIKEHAPRLARRIQNAASDLADRLRRRVEDVDRRLGKLADEATTEGLFDPGLDEQSVVRLAHAIGFGMLLTRSMGLELPAAENWHEVINRVITGLGAPPAGEAMTSGDPS